MLDLAVTALHEQVPERLWPPIVTELLRVWGAKFLVIKSGTWTAGEDTVHLWNPDGTVRTEISPRARRVIRDCHPLAGRYASSADLTPMTAGQIVGEAAWRDSAEAALLRRTVGADHLLGLPLPDISAPVRGFAVYRAGSGFTDAHLDYARQVQPLLAGVARQITLLRSWRASTTKARDEVPAAPAARPAEGRLTPREVTVLALLADALTATAIGRRLGISVRTVQKHIESIYRKLGTKDRITTVLRAQAYGIIPAGA
ncbi:helix-turn-helix transcriptional regulator [Streptomyces pactum]|uniref:helix-turn-helix transcriptional regulator n=1 Tax=Streptomyces pactum TaxID=68249 RepID=UPI0036F8DCB7